MKKSKLGKQSRIERQIKDIKIDHGKRRNNLICSNIKKMKLKIKNGRKVERERGEGLKKNNKIR